MIENQLISTQVKNTDSELFRQIWDIYTVSFPLNEQRTVEHQQRAFESPLYSLEAYHKGSDLIGFTGNWDFENYLYIEHFAINPKFRSGGWGGRIMTDLQQKTDKLLVLEIDEVTDDISVRRERFYTNLGFVPNPFKHPLHIYQPDNQTDTLLQIMTYPTAISEPIYKKFNDQLGRVVMRR